MPRMTPGGARTGARYRNLVAWVKRTYSTCYRCGGPVDKTLSGRDPAGPTLDHAQALALGGDMYDRANAKLSHAWCNSEHGRQLNAALTKRDSSQVAQGHGRRLRAATTHGRQARPVTPMPTTLANPSERW